MYHLVTCAKSHTGLRLTLCPSISTSCCWRMCMKNDSQPFILIPLLQIFNSSVVCSAFHIHVCYLICVRHTLKPGCLSWCILYVLCVVLVLIIQFGQSVNYCKCCVLVHIYHLTLFCFVVFYCWVVCLLCLWFWLLCL